MGWWPGRTGTCRVTVTWTTGVRRGGGLYIFWYECRKVVKTAWTHRSNLFMNKLTEIKEISIEPNNPHPRKRQSPKTLLTALFQSENHHTVTLHKPRCGRCTSCVAMVATSCDSLAYCKDSLYSNWKLSKLDPAVSSFYRVDTFQTWVNIMLSQQYLTPD